MNGKSDASPASSGHKAASCDGQTGTPVPTALPQNAGSVLHYGGIALGVAGQRRCSAGQPMGSDGNGRPRRRPSERLRMRAAISRRSAAWLGEVLAYSGELDRAFRPAWTVDSGPNGPPIPAYPI